MIISEIQNWVASELDILKNAGSLQCHLCLHKGTLCIHPHFKKEYDHKILFIFFEDLVFEGLSPSEWDEVTRTIQIQQLGGYQCQSQLIA